MILLLSLCFRSCSCASGTTICSWGGGRWTPSKCSRWRLRPKRRRPARRLVWKNTDFNLHIFKRLDGGIGKEMCDPRFYSCFFFSICLSVILLFLNLFLSSSFPSLFLSFLLSFLLFFCLFLSTTLSFFLPVIFSYVYLYFNAHFFPSSFSSSFLSLLFLAWFILSLINSLVFPLHLLLFVVLSFNPFFCCYIFYSPPLAFSPSCGFCRFCIKNLYQQKYLL